MFIGIDHAKHGSDTTVVVLESATEVIMRVAEYERRAQPFRERLQGHHGDLMQMILNAKVPCIKYGRRKRKHRRLYPPMGRVEIVV